MFVASYTFYWASIDNNRKLVYGKKRHRRTQMNVNDLFDESNVKTIHKFTKKAALRSANSAEIITTISGMLSTIALMFGIVYYEEMHYISNILCVIVMPFILLLSLKVKSTVILFKKSINDMSPQWIQSTLVEFTQLITKYIEESNEHVSLDEKLILKSWDKFVINKLLDEVHKEYQ